VDFPPQPRSALFCKGAERVYAYLSAHELAMPSFAHFYRKQRWLRRRIGWMTWLTGGEPDCRRTLRQLCRDYGLQRDEQSLAKLGWLWYEPIAESSELCTDVIPTLTALRDNDIKLGLVVHTTYQGAVIDQHLSDLGLLEFFPSRAYSSEIGAQKPQAQLFMAALDLVGVPATKTLYVGDDMKLDIAAAHRVGMQTALRSRSASRRAAGVADYVIRNIGDLLDILALTQSPSRIAATIPPLQLAVK